MLMSVGNITPTLIFLGFLTVLYILHVSFIFLKELQSNKDPEINSQHSWDSDSHLLPGIVEKIHYSASRLCYKTHEATCLALSEIYPEAINTPKYPFKYTPFLKACLAGNTEVIKYMILKGADLTVRTKNGDTPMFLALWSLLQNDVPWDPSCIEVLFRAGCDVNASKEHGYTPLHVAAKLGHVKAVKWLLEHGADPHSLTKCKKKPIDFAIVQGHSEVEALLIKYS